MLGYIVNKSAYTAAYTKSQSRIAFKSTKDPSSFASLKLTETLLDFKSFYQPRRGLVLRWATSFLFFLGGPVTLILISPLISFVGVHEIVHSDLGI